MSGGKFSLFLVEAKTKEKFNFSGLKNSLIGFLSESLVFAKKRANEQFAQKTSDSLIRSFLVNNHE